jgi:hypothetical protein
VVTKERRLDKIKHPPKREREKKIERERERERESKRDNNNNNNNKKNCRREKHKLAGKKNEFKTKKTKLRRDLPVI